jgi:DNA-binding PadR family transcriptional regulator
MFTSDHENFGRHNRRHHDDSFGAPRPDHAGRAGSRRSRPEPGFGPGPFPAGAFPGSGYPGPGPDDALAFGLAFTGRPRGHRRAKKGLLRESILVLLAEQPRNGYQIITALTERTVGAWAPSPGAVYPALAQLTDEGLVEAVDLDGQKAFQLTEAGREAAAAAPSEPWSTEREGSRQGEWPVAELRAVFEELKQLQRALRLAATEASPAQLAAIGADIAALKRKVYATLAEGPLQ